MLSRNEQPSMSYRRGMLAAAFALAGLLLQVAGLVIAAASLRDVRLQRWPGESLYPRWHRFLYRIRLRATGASYQVSADAPARARIDEPKEQLPRGYRKRVRSLEAHVATLERAIRATSKDQWTQSMKLAAKSDDESMRRSREGLGMGSLLIIGGGILQVLGAVIVMGETLPQ